VARSHEARAAGRRSPKVVAGSDGWEAPAAALRQHLAAPERDALGWGAAGGRAYWSQMSRASMSSSRPSLALPSKYVAYNPANARPRATDSLMPHEGRVAHNCSVSHVRWAAAVACVVLGGRRTVLGDLVDLGEHEGEG
jgi:hypothetical protein